MVRLSCRFLFLFSLTLFAICISISANPVALACAPEKVKTKCVVEDIETPTMPACVVESRKGVLYIPRKYWMHPDYNRYGLSAFAITSFGGVYVNRAGRIVLRDVAFMDNFPDEFHHGLVRINRDGLWGLADPTGRIVVPLKYSCALNQENFGPLVCVGCRIERQGEYDVCLDGKWFQTDKRGHLSPSSYK